MLRIPFAVASALVCHLGAFVHAQEYCRCEAEFERFYGRRRLLGGPTTRLVDISVTNSYHHYNYEDAFVNDQGYYVVENVIVLPGSNEKCDARPAGDHYDVDNFMNIFGGDRRGLEGHDAGVRVTPPRKPRELLRRNLSKVGKGGKNINTSNVYNFYGRKGKVCTTTNYTMPQYTRCSYI